MADQQTKPYSEMKQFEKENLTALYKAFDVLQEMDMPTDQVSAAILKIEAGYHE